MNKYRRELSDTESLVRQGLPSAHNCYGANAGSMFGQETPAWGSADRAVQGPQPGRFRRETGAGSESLGNAAKIAEGNN